jgi:predicted phage baseplate assembly protein
MPLPLPALDDRRWTDLVDEGRSFIPLYAPAWTDWNLSDPGITLVELFAWIAEMDLYWLNRVPIERLGKFLALAGMAPRPPRAARVAVSFALAPGAAPADLPADLEVAGEDPGGVLTVFRTLQPVTVGAARLAALQSAGAAAGAPAVDYTARWQRGLPVPLLGDDPQPGAALYLGFDQAPPAGQRLSLYFSFAAPPAAPAGGDAEGHAEGHAGGATVPPHPSVRLAWEAAAAPGLWRALDEAAGEVADDTRALTLDGRVVLAPPAPLAAQRLGGVRDALYYLRCRFVAGAYDAAPVLANLAVNGVLAEQAASLPETVPAAQPPLVPPVAATALGSGNGEPHQRFAFPAAPVLASTLELYSVEAGRLRRWRPRFDFDGSRRTDAHVVVDLQQGLLTCGDGEAGRTIPEGAPFVARYRATRGADGNLPAGTVTEIAGTPHNLALPGLGSPAVFAALLKTLSVTNPLPAAGGADAESEPAAAARAAAEMRATTRAITLADYEQLALRTPGTRIARVTALANFDPAFPCLEAIGVVTVIVLPYLPLARPRPSPGLLRAVGAWLARRRLIGTRVVVAGPAYREVAVSATVQALPHADPAALQARILAALDAFFHPLTGGPAGQGWPFGRAVYRAEVLQVLSEVPGTDSVTSLALVLGDGTAVCGNVCLAATELVAAGTHDIQLG